MSLPIRSATEKLLRPVMPELDSLRGIAILLVLFFHGFDFPGVMSRMTGFARVFVIAACSGWIGWYLFFALSGFLITGILLESKSKPQYYRRFYIRRALRILPAFYLLLLLLCILPRTGWLDHRHIGWPFITLSFFYLANVSGLLGVPVQYAALWSLAVEEHFYLVWPTVIKRLSAQRATYCAVSILVACPVLRAAAYLLGYNAGAGYTWLVADSLAMGALVALLSRGWLKERAAMRQFAVFCLVAAVALFIGGTPVGIWRGSTFFGRTFRPIAVNLLCTGILVVTLLVGSSQFKRMVQHPVLRWFGEISYGLYLVHMLAFDFIDHWIIRYFPTTYKQIPFRMNLMFLRFFTSVAVAVGVAFLSRRYFEEWFLRLKDRWTGPAAEANAYPATTAIAQEPAQRTA